MLECAKNEDATIISREIIFDIFQHMRSQYSTLRTDRRTDRRLAKAILRSVVVKLSK